MITNIIQKEWFVRHPQRKNSLYFRLQVRKSLTKSKIHSISKIFAQNQCTCTLIGLYIVWTLILLEMIQCICPHSIILLAFPTVTIFRAIDCIQQTIKSAVDLNQIKATKLIDSQICYVLIRNTVVTICRFECLIQTLVITLLDNILAQIIDFRHRKCTQILVNE